MATRRALVAMDGTLAELPSGDALADAQAPLESGVNLKTINGASLLGAGDLVLPVITVAATPPADPALNALWLDIS